jgi:hypothetical protein
MVAEDYVVVLPRPQLVKEWSDVNDVLVQRAEHLMAALGAGWEIEGPLYENRESSVELYRQLRADAQKREDIYLAVSIGVEATGDPLPPNPLPIHVHVAERNEFVEPMTKAGKLLSYVVVGAIMAGGAGVGLLVRLAIGGMFLALLAGFVGMIALLMAAGAIKTWIVGAPAEPSTPSPDFVALVASVKDQLPPS